MLFNPLLDCMQDTRATVDVRAQWADIVDKSANAIERYLRNGNTKKAFKELHLMDLLDRCTADWFRDQGFVMYGSPTDDKILHRQLYATQSQVETSTVAELALETQPVSLV